MKPRYTISLLILLVLLSIGIVGIVDANHVSSATLTHNQTVSYSGSSGAVFNELTHSNNRLYGVRSGGTLEIYNTSLQQVSSYSLETVEGTVFDIKNHGDTLVIAGQNSSCTCGAIELLDISNPDNPTTTNSITNGSTGIYSQVAGNGPYYAIGLNIDRYSASLTHEESGNIGTTTDGTFEALLIDEGHLFATTGNDIFSFDATNLQELQRITNSSNVDRGGAVIQGNTLLTASNNDTGLVQIDISDPGNMTWEGVFMSGTGGGNEFVKSGDDLYWGNNSNLYRIDISSPFSPSELENVSVGGSKVTSSTSQIFMDDAVNNNLISVDTSNPVATDNPTLSNATPNDTSTGPQPNLEIQVNDSEFPAGDTVDVEFYDFDTGNQIGTTQTLTSNGTASVQWTSATFAGTYRWYVVANDSDGNEDVAGIYFFTIGANAPVLSNADPRNDDLVIPSTNVFVTDGVFLSVDVNDSDFPDDEVNVSWWNAANDNLIVSRTPTSNGTSTSAWDNVPRGYNTYYITATDQAGNQVTDGNYRFKTPGQLTFYDAGNGNQITQAIDVRITGPNTQETITVSDGTFEWEDKTDLQDTEYQVQVSSSGFATQTFTIQDVALSHNIYLTSTIQDITYELNDNSGEFPGTDTILKIAEDITSNGTVTNLTAQNYFGADNSATFQLEQGNTYELYVENTASGDGRHVGTYTVPASSDTQTITIGRSVGADWRINDATASPSGGTVVDGDGGETLEINITDMDGNDVINVSFYNATTDNRIASQEVSGSGTNTATVSWSVPSGRLRSWYVIATDENNVTRTSDVHSFGTSGALTFRETGTGNLITDTITLNITLPNGQVLDRSVGSGYWNWSNLSTIPQDEVAIDINSTDYFATTLQLSTVAQNNTVFLVETMAFTGQNLDVIFTLEDRTGDFTPVRNTTLVIERDIQGNFTEVESEEFGAGNKIQVQLISGTEYLLSVRQGSNQRELGDFETTTSGTFNLVIDNRDFNLTTERAWGWNASLNQQTIYFNYSDTASETRRIEVAIYEYNNESNELLNRTVTGRFGNYSLTEALTGNQSENAWVVEFEADRDQETVTGSKVVGQDAFDLLTAVPDWVLEVVAVLLIILTGAAFSPLNAKMGAVTVGVVAGILYLAGLLSGVMTGLSIAGVIGVSLLYKMSEVR